MFDKDFSEIWIVMAKKILIMGLPGAGKTYLSERLAPILNATWLNADEVRKKMRKEGKL